MSGSRGFYAAKAPCTRREGMGLILSPRKTKKYSKFPEGGLNDGNQFGSQAFQKDS